MTVINPVSPIQRPSSLIEPWRKLPRTIALYAVTGAVGAVLLTAAHVAFPDQKNRQHAEPLISQPPVIIRSDIYGKGNDKISDRGINFPAWHSGGGANATIPFEPPSGGWSEKQFSELEDKMQLADAGNDAQLIAQMIENAPKKPEALTNYLNDNGLENKYPTGLAVFFADGSKVLAYDQKKYGNVTFDLSNLNVKTGPRGPCIELLAISQNDKHIVTFSNVCVSGEGVVHFAKIGSMTIDIVPIAESSRGTAWVVGVKPN